MYFEMSNYIILLHDLPEEFKRIRDLTFWENPSSSYVVRIISLVEPSFKQEL